MNLTELQEEFCHQCSNSSCFRRASLAAVDMLMYSSIAAVVLLTVCGNLLVIISICHFKHLHTPTNLLLLSLAVADLLVGLTIMPFYFSELIESHWCFGEIYYIIYSSASFYLTSVSIYNVAFIAVDQYLALYNPFLYSTKITVNLTLKILSILWLCSLIYNFAFVYLNLGSKEENSACADTCIQEVCELLCTVDFIITFIVPCSTIVIMYLNIFFIAKKHAHSIKCAREKNHSKDKRKLNVASERKAAKKLSILVSAFLICITPSYISVFLSVYMRKASVYLSAANMLGLLYLNSSINPIIYALLYSWFQKCVKLIVTLRICRSESSRINVHLKDT